MSFFNLIEKEFFNNTVPEWISAAVAAAVIFIGLRFIQHKGFKKLEKIASRERTGWVPALFEALGKTNWIILFIFSFYIGARGLDLPGVVENNLRIAAFILFFVQLGLWAGGLLDGWARRYRERQIKVNPAAVTTLGAARLMLHGLIWAGVFVLILDNMGFDITALVAGLGIGGVAVALAVQNILGDLFSSLSIVVDKTFAVGDFLVIDQYAGTVENIGLKTTRIRSLSGEQLIFSNSDLLKGRIRNYGRMYERRIAVTIGVVYETGREKLKKIPQIIREAIEAQERTRFDRAHFLSYGDYALHFEYVYFVLSADYNTYMDINQAINFSIHEKFEQEGIAFAYPTRTLYLRPQAPGIAGS